MKHMFDTEIATEVGVHAASILECIARWVNKNIANEKHFHDGNCWVYNSTKAFASLFPYLSADQIRRAIDKLRESGYIVTENYNQSPYDHTQWFALTDKAKRIYTECQIDLANLPNLFGKNHKPIPSEITTCISLKRKHTKEKVSSPDDMFGLDDGTPEELPEDVKPETCYSFDEFWEDYGKKVGRANAELKFKRISEKDRAVIKEKLPEYIAATPDKAFRKNPSTYLNGKCWNDEIVTRDEINRSRFTKHEQVFYGSYGRYQPVKHN